MVVHDMRNPTSSIRLGLQHTKEKLDQIILHYENHLIFSRNNVSINNNLAEDGRDMSIVERC
jgi:hypothetical protein